MPSPRSYGRYELLERVAVGGMGEIWRAKLQGLEGFEKTVAIKKILPHLSDDPQFVERLVVEAKIAVALSHANVVEVYELGTVEGEYYISMEYVEGPDLSTMLHRVDRQDMMIPVPLAVYIGSCMCKALDYAHRKTDESGQPMNIVHRDVSPQNILLSIDGAVKLSDFGIARAAGVARLYHTDMGVVLGKRRYMAPEQRRGETVDSRADVFAAGAVLYEMVTGEAPEEEDPVKPSEMAEHIPNKLDAILMDALTPEPAKRPTAGKIAQRLERLYPKLVVEGEKPPVDAASALSAFVRELFPPEERQTGTKRSLTDFVNAAMGARGDEIGPDSEEDVIPASENPTASQAIESTVTPDPVDALPVDENTAPSVDSETVDTAAEPVRRPPGESTLPPETAVIVATARAQWRQDIPKRDDGDVDEDGGFQTDKPTPTQPTGVAPTDQISGERTGPTPTAPSKHVESLPKLPDDDSEDSINFDPPTQPSQMALRRQAKDSQSRLTGNGKSKPSKSSDPVDTTRAPGPPGSSGVDIFPGAIPNRPRRITNAKIPAPRPPSQFTVAFRYIMDAPEARLLRILLLVFAAVLAVVIGVVIESMLTQ